MSKKLLMNNYFENNDEIVLCENYTPTNIPFYLYKDKIIDWDNYELYINLNIEGNTFSNWNSALVISSDDDIGSWGATANNGKIHVYYKKDMIRLQPVSGKFMNDEVDKSLTYYNKENIQLIINESGIYLENQIITMSLNRVFKDVMNCLKTSNITTIGISALGCTYNKVSLRKYQERG